MKLLAIPEDPTHDSYIIKPVIERIMTDCGVTGSVEVLRDPHLRGTSHALDKKMISEIIMDNRMIDLFILVVDRDCDRMKNEAKAASIEAEHNGKLLSCVAIQELEVWPLVFYRNEINATWKEIRESCDPKEEFFEPLMSLKGWATHIGGGRKTAMSGISGNWASMKQLCEEIQALRDKFLRVRPASWA